MKRIFILLFVMTALCGLYMNAGNLRVIDKEDGTPIIGASVLSRTGIILGLTDSEGSFSISNQQDYPVEIRCLGYESAFAPDSVQELALPRMRYELGELIITPIDRPVQHLICYVREYISSATDKDTMLMFNEHMADFLLPQKKVKGFKAFNGPRFLCSNLYTRVSDREGRDSIFKPAKRDEAFCWEVLLEMPAGKTSLDEKFCSDAMPDTVRGKHGLKEIMRKDGSICYITKDYLADKKDHSWSPMIFKLLGITMDITEFQTSMAVNVGNACEYTAAYIVSATATINILGRGKWIKKAFKTDCPVNMYSIYEIYPIGVEYLTVDEANEIKKNPPSVSMQVSEDALPLTPMAKRLVDYFPE